LDLKDRKVYRGHKDQQDHKAFKDQVARADRVDHKE